MIAAKHPQQEQRLAALRELEILDTDFEDEYDHIVELASHLCEVPIAVVNLIDTDRQWFKAEKGLGVRSTPLDTSLCSHVILEKDFVEIPDTLRDPRMSDNPLCLEEGGLRFYAGALLKSEDGLPLGTLCVLDNQPRTLTQFQVKALRMLAGQVNRLLDLRLSLKRQQIFQQEIDHRVKNSLASVYGLVRMQASRAQGEVREALDVVGKRIGAVAALHEQLHMSMSGTDIDLAPFVQRLADKLISVMAPGSEVELELADANLSSNSGGAIGLIVNEFISNAGKHSSDTDGKALVHISGNIKEGTYTLRFTHRHHLAADTLDRIANSKGLGGRVIEASTRSIAGVHEWSGGDKGLVLEISFPAGT